MEYNKKYKFYIVGMDKPERDECESIEYYDGTNHRWLPSLQPFEYKEYIYRYVLKAITPESSQSGATKCFHCGNEKGPIEQCGICRRQLNGS